MHAVEVKPRCLYAHGCMVAPQVFHTLWKVLGTLYQCKHVGQWTELGRCMQSWCFAFWCFLDLAKHISSYYYLFTEKKTILIITHVHGENFQATSVPFSFSRCSSANFRGTACFIATPDPAHGKQVQQAMAVSVNLQRLTLLFQKVTMAGAYDRYVYRSSDCMLPTLTTHIQMGYKYKHTCSCVGI